MGLTRGYFRAWVRVVAGVRVRLISKTLHVVRRLLLAAAHLHRARLLLLHELGLVELGTW